MNNYLYPNSSVMPSEEEMLLEELKKRMIAPEPDRSPSGDMIQQFQQGLKTATDSIGNKKGLSPQAEVKTTRNINETVPIEKKYRDELRQLPDQFRDVPSDGLTDFGFIAQKEGLQDIKDKIEAALAQQTKEDWRIPIVTAAQFLASPSGDNSSLMEGMKLMQNSSALQQKERQDLLEKLYTLKQKQEQGMVNSSLGAMKVFTGGGNIKTDESSSYGVKADAERANNREKNFELDVQKFEKRISPFVEMTSIFNQLDSLIPGGIDKWSGEDIPGAGLTKHFFRFATSDKGNDIRDLWGNLKDSIMRARSGAAISIPEAARLNSALGDSVFSSDKDMIQGLRRFKIAMNDVYRSRQAGYKPEVVKEYADRLQDPAATSFMIGNGSTPNVSYEPTGLTPEQQKRLEELRKKYPNAR